jgi:hypothetical protein
MQDLIDDISAGAARGWWLRMAQRLLRLRLGQHLRPSQRPPPSPAWSNALALPRRTQRLLTPIPTVVAAFRSGLPPENWSNAGLGLDGVGGTTEKAGGGTSPQSVAMCQGLALTPFRPTIPPPPSPHPDTLPQPSLAPDPLFTYPPRPHPPTAPLPPPRPFSNPTPCRQAGLRDIACDAPGNAQPPPCSLMTS